MSTPIQYQSVENAPACLFAQKSPRDAPFPLSSAGADGNPSQNFLFTSLGPSIHQLNQVELATGLTLAGAMRKENLRVASSARTYPYYVGLRYPGL